MKKIIFLVLALVSIFSNMQAQVTIGSGEPPHKDALLDLKESLDGTSRKGFLLPRVSLKATNIPTPMANHVTGMTVYNMTPSDTSDPAYEAAYHVSRGLYYNDGNQWIKLHLGATNWFYMPSVSFNTTANASRQTKNLYQLYENQFASPAYASTGAPAKVPHIPQATDLYYYILDVDSNVFSNISIDEYGLMTYDEKASATDCTYINIVFVIK